MFSKRPPAATGPENSVPRTWVPCKRGPWWVPFVMLMPRTPHPVRPFPRGRSPPPVRYPRRAQRPGVRSLCPEEFLGTLCHPIAAEGSRSTTIPAERTWPTLTRRGQREGRTRIVSTRELFLSEWRRCAERRRERKREILASRLRSTRLSIRPPFNKGRFTTKKNSNVSFSVS